MRTVCLAVVATAVADIYYIFREKYSKCIRNLFTNSHIFLCMLAFTKWLCLALVVVVDLNPSSVDWLALSYSLEF